MTRRPLFTGQLLLFCLLGLMAMADLASAKDTVPREIAGIALGSRVDAYPDIVRSNYLKEMVVTDWHGFRNGVISYGSCRYQGQILKIDMKYEEKSKEFYNTLLARYRERFGEPDSWAGDSFGVMLVWKWQFVDGDGNRISLSLQHNSKDTDETLGNMVKLSFPEKLEEERRCFVDMCTKRHQETDEQRREELKKTDWSYLIPR